MRVEPALSVESQGYVLIVHCYFGLDSNLKLYVRGGSLT